MLGWFRKKNKEDVPTDSAADEILTEEKSAAEDLIEEIQKFCINLW